VDVFEAELAEMPGGGGDESYAVYDPMTDAIYVLKQLENVLETDELRALAFHELFHVRQARSSGGLLGLYMKSRSARHFETTRKRRWKYWKHRREKSREYAAEEAAIKETSFAIWSRMVEKCNKIALEEYVRNCATRLERTA